MMIMRKMTVPKQLTDITTRPPLEIQKISKKGGKVRSPGKKRGAKLREIKKRIKAGNIKSDDEKWLLERLENKELFDIDMLSFLDEIRKEVNTPNQKMTLANNYNNLSKQIHGDKSNVTNIQINVMSDDVAKSVISRLLNEDNTITVSKDNTER